MDQNLQDNYDFFITNKDKLFKQYPNKFIVIKDKEIIGVYDDQVTAYTTTTKDNEPGTFIIEKCSPSSTDVQVFHSRVSLL